IITVDRVSIGTAFPMNPFGSSSLERLVTSAIFLVSWGEENSGIGISAIYANCNDGCNDDLLQPRAAAAAAAAALPERSERRRPGATRTGGSGRQRRLRRRRRRVSERHDTGGGNDDRCAYYERWQRLPQRDARSHERGRPRGAGRAQQRRHRARERAGGRAAPVRFGSRVDAAQQQHPLTRRGRVPKGAADAVRSSCRHDVSSNALTTLANVSFPASLTLLYVGARSRSLTTAAPMISPQSPSSLTHTRNVSRNPIASLSAAQLPARLVQLYATRASLLASRLRS
ncbi:hypothetical protein PybrP1_000219, partial [[Pythium] brassicae (nom. inval.)]